MRLVIASLLVVLAVPVSSLLGLSKPMGDLGGDVFGDVWAANLWGDLVFIVLTAGTAAGTGWLLAFAWRRDPLLATIMTALAVPAAFFLTWVTYCLAWTLTGPAFGEDGSFFAVDGAGDIGEAWRFVWDQGKTGIWVMGVLVPLFAALWQWLPGGAALARRTMQNES